ncbi:MAG TPA: phosphonate C-P lyase system protein PhnG [Syntrophales bacterium]|nr:phosphonate C-P lyase system protein PhnG [Syntrophales bacterium]
MKRLNHIPAETLPACITQMPERAVRKLLGLVSGEGISVVRGPLTGLVMMSALDSFEADFFLGEVLVTEVEMDYAGCRGYGMVIGDDAERAIARATVEAIAASPNRILQERVNRFLQAEAKKLQARRKKEASLIARTRVDFETMKRT